jgi:hypothetical protein
MHTQRRPDVGEALRGGSALAVLAATVVALAVLVAHAGPLLDAGVAGWTAQVRALLAPSPPAPTQWTRRALWTSRSWQVASVRTWSTP